MRSGVLASAEPSETSGAGSESSPDPSPDLVSRVTVSITGGVNPASPLLHRGACHKADILNAASSSHMDYRAAQPAKKCFFVFCFLKFKAAQTETHPYLTRRKARKLPFSGQTLPQVADKWVSGVGEFAASECQVYQGAY